MSALWTPGQPRAQSIVDSRVDALLRQRHIDRLLATADQSDDKAYEVAASMGLPRARYAEYLAERYREMAAEVAAEPLRKAFAGIGR